MINKVYQSRLTTKAYCDVCRADYLTESPEAGCPVCAARKQAEKQPTKNKKKGGE